MRSDVINIISKKDAYLTAVSAVTGAKTVYTEDEKTSLVKIYQENAEIKFGFADELLLRLIIVLDTAQDKADPMSSPFAGDLSENDRDALTALWELYKKGKQSPKEIEPVKTAALSKNVSKPLALALARAALDVLVDQTDISPYREDIGALADLLKNAEDDTFSDASNFLIRVRGRVQ